MSGVTRVVVWIAAALVAAVAFSALAFAVIVTPFDRFPGPQAVQEALVFLDAPASVANRLLPEEWRSHMTVLLRCGHTYCFPAPVEVEAARYMRSATPAYLLLFCVPLAFTSRFSGRG